MPLIHRARWATIALTIATIACGSSSTVIGDEPQTTNRRDDSTDSAASDSTAADSTAADSESSSEPDGTNDAQNQNALRNKVRECLKIYYRRHERVSEHSPWGIMHSLIAFGVDTQVIVEDRKVNAIGWLCWNQPCRGMRLFYTNRGKLQARLGPGVQGHSGQFLCMLAQSRVPIDYAIKVGGKEFTIADLVEMEKETCRSQTELTFKLIALSHYLKSDEEWKNDIGEKWSIQRLIKEELRQSVIGAACGGTHRMMGFSFAVNKRKKRKEPITGEWKRAEKYVLDYYEYTFKLQNPDGSFSTEWFEGRGANTDIERRLQTTGHTLEWLAFSLTKEQLKEERVTKAVDYLATLMLKHSQRNWAIGPLGHAVHAIAIYDERVFGGKVGERDKQLSRRLAKKPNTDVKKK